MPKSDAQRAADARYDAANTTQIKMKLNKKTDADILEKLKACGNVQGYIKKLIRDDLKAAANLQTVNSIHR